MSDLQSWVRRIGALWRRFGTMSRLVAVAPALSLGAFFIAGEAGLFAFAVAAPLALWVAATVPRLGFAARTPAPRDIADLVCAADRALARQSAGACYVALFHDLPKIRLLHGPAGIDALIDGVFARVAAGSRSVDRVARLHDAGIAVFLTVPDHLAADAALARAQRLLDTVAQPVALGAARVFASVSVGYCKTDHAAIADGKSLLDAARLAAEDALAHAPGSIRAFEPAHLRRRIAQSALLAELEAALGSGQIRPWFQPQICADTLAITGAEALARWVHPQRGLIPPADFLPIIAASGRAEALTKLMLSGALDALGQWDRAGIRVPHVSINLGAQDLRNPRLPDILAWELDRCAKPPERLTVEILEDVAARIDDDVITRNLARIRAMGCGIDMDDFGMGQTAIANIRRLNIRRIKIDHAFVTRVDTDADQKRVVSAILSMAERLGLHCVAEGVETAGELSTLAQLGCDYLQGFGIARPMPPADFVLWARQRRRDGQLLPRKTS